VIPLPLMADFDHERLDVYKRALDFVVAADAIRKELPAGRGALADQLDRAAVSIALNIAEGAGEFAPREKARFYRIARRSATECAAILDVAARLDLVDHEQIASAKEQLRAMVAMLIVLGKRKETE
jgi:four helix bundle protein